MHAHCSLVPFYLSLSFALCLFSRLLTSRFSLFQNSSSPSCSTEAECARRSNPSSLRSFSFPTVFLPLPHSKRSNPTSPPPTSSFSSATLPSLPHLLFSYQPGRTRIHILQAFMMAAAHLCEPACWAASSLPRAGSPPSNQSDTGSAQANPALLLLLSSTTIPHHSDAS